MQKDTHLGHYLRKLRQGKSWSVREMGERTGYSGSYISQMETGIRPVTIERAWLLIEALGGDMRYALYLLALDAGVPAEALQEERE